jgi:hypothetical protein
MTVNTLAAELVMDCTTLGATPRPRQRDGLGAVGLGKTDRRSRRCGLTRSRV